MPIKVNNSMIIDVEEYIKDLSPELQEKARACRSNDELLALAKEHNVQLPDEALEAAAGGASKEEGFPDEPCPKRDNNLPHDFKVFDIDSGRTIYRCRYCDKTCWNWGPPRKQ